MCASLVEQVIQTATKVLDGGLAAREAVTVLATLTREAVPAARDLRETDPDRAATYGELILALGQGSAVWSRPATTRGISTR